MIFDLKPNFFLPEFSSKVSSQVIRLLTKNILINQIQSQIIILNNSLKSIIQTITNNNYQSILTTKTSYL